MNALASFNPDPPKKAEVDHFTFYSLEVLLPVEGG